MLRVALFDLDGTLVNSDDAVVWAVTTLLENHGIPDVPREEITKRIGVGLKPLLETFIPDPDVYVDEYRSIYRQGFKTRTYVYPGVLETLRELKNNCVKTAIVTNRNHDLSELIIKHFKIAENIDKLVAHTGKNKLKPDPEMIFTALGEFDVPSEEAMMVGDTEIDIETGKNAGLMTVKVDYKDSGERTEADVTVESISDILKYFM